MINDNIIVNWSVKRLQEGYKPIQNINNWVDYSRFLLRQIREIRDLDFTAIGMSDLSIIENTQVEVGKRIILCDYLDCNCEGPDSDHASILGRVIRIKPDDPFIIELEIEGIGNRSDYSRDPDRKLTWGTRIYPDLRNYHTILELTSKPRANGGPVYYYYNKDIRDSRVNWIYKKPIESARCCIGSVKTISTNCLKEVRQRAQYIHYFRKLNKDISLTIKDTKDLGLNQNQLLLDLYEVLIKTEKTKDTAKPLSKLLLEIIKKYEEK